MFHQKNCITAVLARTKAEREINAALDVDAELHRLYATMQKLNAACEVCLTDPDSPDNFNVGPREDETKVIYVESNGDGKAKRKQATLAELLARVERSLPLTVTHTQLNMTDIRRLTIESQKQLTSQLDVLAKLRGLYKAANRARRRRSQQYDQSSKRDHSRIRRVHGWSLERAAKAIIEVGPELRDKIEAALNAQG